MTQPLSPLVTFYRQGWENHHQALIASITPLTQEQLSLPVAPHHTSIGELLAHMVDARISWFHGWMGESNKAMIHWHEERLRNTLTTYEATELAASFEESWQVISSAMERWNFADLERVFPAAHQAWLQSQGFEEEPAHTRQWIVWHVLEHEIHHGGELSLALGTHGLESFYTW
ncbi:DinB family protein [Ktedonospora formicarum]|uniref:DinB-like domain-containing protein n=1 Tax=Ktedonospora formicarum TaxID=2778364 RepID=A0A8J3IB33_9CHLR|nr:DinB family protein [Ktedonospora formicarum]GHO49372.1 hypothetical protein KSX_75350 [Ktedonospora formicarum]